MASYDQLSAQQRAIVDLILKRGQGYDQLADTLGMPEDRVRELARETLTNLAPVSAAAVDEDWRSQIADYLLGQQPPPEAAATRGHLRRSEAARAWSRSVLDSLEHLYANGDLPTIPSGDNGPEPAPARKTAAARGELSPQAEAIVRRRRALGIAAIGALLLFILLIWPVGLLTGGDDDGDGERRAGNRTEIVGQVVLRPVAGSNAGADDPGIAIITRRGDTLEMALQAQVPPTKRNQAYEVWLYNSASDARSLGAQVTDQQGVFAGKATLPANYRSYRYIDISRETVDRNQGHSGTSILRARTSAIQRPQGNQADGGASTAPQPAPAQP
jgi:hypothetical protein